MDIILLNNHLIIDLNSCAFCKSYYSNCWIALHLILRSQTGVLELFISCKCRNSQKCRIAKFTLSLNVALRDNLKIIWLKSVIKQIFLTRKKNVLLIYSICISIAANAIRIKCMQNKKATNVELSKF